MREFIALISNNGQVTIPAEIRKHLGIKAHDRMAFIIDEEGGGQLTVPRYSNIGSLAGAAGSLSRPLSWKDMRRIAYEERFSASYADEDSLV